MTDPIALGFESAPGIALGAYLNNQLCVVRDGAAYMSGPIGDLDSREACEKFDASVERMLSSLQLKPQWVASDLHPDFYSTRVGLALADQYQIPFVQVQHHHAHIGALMAEHQLRKPTLGFALDGYGLGSDGAAWGGELLLVDGAGVERIGHLQPLPLPGGDRAAVEPWRMGAAALFELGRRDEIVARFGAASAMLATMIERGVNSPRTSSAGRLFDAAAGLLGIQPVTTFDGQAAVMLEKLAASFGDVEPLRSGYVIENETLNMLPLLAQLADMQDVPRAAALFHATLAAGLEEWMVRVAYQRDIGTVVLGGGCFFNRILSKKLRSGLEKNKLKVFEASAVPPGDAGLSLGQAWVALQSI